MTHSVKTALKGGTAALVLSTSLLCTNALASEQHNDDIYGPMPKNAGYLDIAVGVGIGESVLKTEDDDAYLNINPRFGYRWDNIFFETGKLGQRGVGLGYNFFESKNWEIDALLHVSHPEISDDDNDALKGIREREGDARLGIRATRYFDNAQLRFIVSPKSVSHGDDGVYAAVWYGKQWRYNDWDLHANLGAEYYSDEILDHFYGTDPLLDGENFAAYKADSGVVLSAQVGASYDITEDWRFEVYANLAKVPDAIADSPLTDEDLQNAVGFNVVYRF